MGAACCSSMEKGNQAEAGPAPASAAREQLSENAKKQLEILFKKFDVDGSHCISREEATKFFGKKFGKLSVDAMFRELDVDNSGTITFQEYLEFWQNVKDSGYKEEEILEEVEEMMTGGSWVDWKDNRDVGDNMRKSESQLAGN
eukprot:gnl/TRDRNA2_/TRDRNA2_91047_c1_seq1.p1 gnl/TRDRNA2_/TRDRNA2_91047_c1~~gnl/TRDRNA2_/TRDRNA2_91047_c1_seq1.p1  ORF type:complete len:144 (-),score=40.21 gnl/TRDRNA2_/TRDRNA2_91047_c1_seq1:117-548(-)